jgi:hypothetical protein
MGTSTESRAERGPEGQAREVTEEQIRRALQRTARENVPPNPREAERWQAENQRDAELLIAAVEMLPQDGRLLQQRLEHDQRKSSAPHLIEAQRRALVPIGIALQRLKEDPLRASFRPEDFGSLSVQHFQGVLREIDTMIDQAQREGLVTIVSGRLFNCVGHAADVVNRLTNILAGEVDSITRRRKGALLTPQQRQYVEKVRAFFQRVLNGEPAYGQAKRVMRERPPQSEAVRKGIGALKMLGLLVVGGIALFGNVTSLIKRRVPDPYSLALLGLTAYLAGFFPGRERIIKQQLDFLMTPEWERLRITLDLKGQEGIKFIDFMRQAHQGTGAGAKKARELLQQGQRTRQVPKEEYIQSIVGENPQGDNAYAEAKLKKLTPSQLYLLGTALTSVTDPTALSLLRDVVEKNINTQTAAPDLRAALARLPSASTHGGTPRGRPPRR